MQVARESLNQNALNTLIRVESQIATWRKNRKILLSIEHQGTCMYLDSLGLNYWIGIDTPNTFYVNYFTKAFTFEDAPDLFEVIESLDEIFGEPTVDDSPFDSIRTYTFTRNEQVIVFCCHLTSDAICQRQLIGEERVMKIIQVEETKPVYKFTC